MRVRSGRFEKLRSRETEHAETLEVRDSQHPIDVAIAMAPPASGIRSYPPRHRGRSAQFPQFPERGRASLPMLELVRPQLMPQPFIQRAPDARRLCQPEVELTPTRVRPCWARQKERAPKRSFSKIFLCSLYVRGLLAFRALSHFELDLLAFLQRLESTHLNCGEMRKQILTAIVRSNETIPLHH